MISVSVYNTHALNSCPIVCTWLFFKNYNMSYAISKRSGQLVLRHRLVCAFADRTFTNHPLSVSRLKCYLLEIVTLFWKFLSCFDVRVAGILFSVEPPCDKNKQVANSKKGVVRAEVHNHSEA